MKRAIEADKKVSLMIQIECIGNLTRPDKFVVTYKIGIDEEITRTIKN